MRRMFSENQIEVVFSELFQEMAGVSSFWFGTQDEYDALTPDENVLYFILEE